MDNLLPNILARTANVPVMQAKELARGRYRVTSQSATLYNSSELSLRLSTVPLRVIVVREEASVSISFLRVPCTRRITDHAASASSYGSCSSRHRA
nr:hypothetical protein CFP56_21285 [Quercus suber]